MTAQQTDLFVDGKADFAERTVTRFGTTTNGQFDPLAQFGGSPGARAKLMAFLNSL